MSETDSSPSRYSVATSDRVMIEKLCDRFEDRSRLAW